MGGEVDDGPDPFRYGYPPRVEDGAGDGREASSATHAKVPLHPEPGGAVPDATVPYPVTLPFEGASVEREGDELDFLPARLTVFLLVPFGHGGLGRPPDRACQMKLALIVKGRGFSRFLLSFIGGLRPFGTPRLKVH